MTKKQGAIALLGLLLIILAANFLFGDRLVELYRSIDWQSFEQFYQQNSFIVSLGLFLAYVVVAALSIPGAALMTVLIGVMLGLWKGVLLVSFASSIGASLAFLISRYFFRDILSEKYASKFKLIDSNIEKNGAMYLLILRLVPIFPFFLINVLMGLTRIELWKFYILSQIGMLPATFIFINAADSFTDIKSFSEIYSARTLVSLFLLIILIVGTNIALRYLRKKDSKVDEV